MILDLIGTDRVYDVQSLTLLFYPNSNFTEDDGKKLTVSFDGKTAEAVLNCPAGEFKSQVRMTEGFDSERLAIKRSAYNVLSEATGIKSPWGLLTGIKSALYYGTLKSVHGDKAYEIFKEKYLVTPEKIELCQKVLDTRRDAVELIKKDTCSVYFSIPFCPTRCSYCSFVSSATANEGKFLEPYVERLIEEIKIKGQLLINEDFKILSMYMGGGTPTVLSEKMLDRVLTEIEDSFNFDYLQEFTVEAGRPDTITREKLSVLKNHGIKRISVNPQTLNDSVLKVIGRRHTAEDFFRAYELAESMGFSVNIDVIAGLPTDTEDSFCDSLERIAALNSDNVTLHTLYVKKASDIHSDTDALSKEHQYVTGKMVSFAEKLLDNNGYLPYYLYRQKNTVGNHENVGYAKKGKECIYNIAMMDDIQTVIGVGANAVTKVVHDKGHINRFANTKFSYNYIKDDFKEISFEP